MRKVLITLIVILGAVILFTQIDGGFFEDMTTRKNLLGQQEPLPIIKSTPPPTGIDSWINTEPLTEEDLRGKVVLVDFWTYSCINCIRTFPHIQGWHDKYKDNNFIVLGIHSPEFEFEKKKENVEQAVQEYGITYPVALDNDHTTWNAYENRFWPAHYLIDTEGNLRYQIFGEGRYAETESAIQNLLLESGLLTIDKISEVTEPEGSPEFQKISTPEIYLGYLRINNVGNADQNVHAGVPHAFEPIEGELEDSLFYFTGTWTIGPESARAGEEAGLLLRYKASKANVVVAAEEEGELQVLLEGSDLNESNKGTDVKIRDGKAFVDIDEPRLYNLTDTGDSYEWRTIEIHFDPGVEIFTFTFG